MSIRLSPAVESLVKALGKLPGYGPRSAQRAAFHLLQNRDESLDELAAAVERVRRGVGRCRLCNTFTEGDICPVCLDEERDPGLLCVVESTADQMALDASLAWPGYYFVLSGRLSPVNGIGPADIGMPLLLKRVGAGVEEGVLREVVVAMSYTPEGDATAYYLIRRPQEAVAAAARHPPCKRPARRHRNRVHGPEHDRQRGLRQKGCLRGRARPLGPPPDGGKTECICRQKRPLLNRFRMKRNYFSFVRFRTMRLGFSAQTRSGKGLSRLHRMTGFPSPFVANGSARQ